MKGFFNFWWYANKYGGWQELYPYDEYKRRHAKYVQYVPRNMHTVFALLCFVVVIYWLIFPYPSGLLHWHCGNLTITPVPAKQPWWIWINTSCEFIMNDCIPTTKQSTTKPYAYFLGYTVYRDWRAGWKYFSGLMCYRKGWLYFIVNGFVKGWTITCFIYLL